MVINPLIGVNDYTYPAQRIPYMGWMTMNHTPFFDRFWLGTYHMNHIRSCMGVWLKISENRLHQNCCSSFSPLIFYVRGVILRVFTAHWDILFVGTVYTSCIPMLVPISVSTKFRDTFSFAIVCCHSILVSQREQNELDTSVNQVHVQLLIFSIKLQ